MIAAHEVEGEGDSDEWVSSESVSVTPQNESSGSESGDDDVAHNLPPNLHLTGAAHVATSPDDREPPTPTMQVKMQPPTPANNVREEESRRRLPAAPAPNERGPSAATDGADRHDGKRFIMSTGDDHPDAAVDNVGDPAYPHSDHHACPEEGLASTPRPRALADRDTEPSRRLPPDPLADRPNSDSPARKPPAANPRLGGGVQDRPQQSALSVHPAQQSPPCVTNDSSPAPGANNNPQVRDQNTMTQVSKDSPTRIITNLPYVWSLASSNHPYSYSSMLRVFPCSINNSGHQPRLAERIPPLVLLRAQHISGTRVKAYIQAQLSGPGPVLHQSILYNQARTTSLLLWHVRIRSSVDHLQ